MGSSLWAISQTGFMVKLIFSGARRGPHLNGFSKVDSDSPNWSGSEKIGRR